MSYRSYVSIQKWSMTIDRFVTGDSSLVHQNYFDLAHWNRACHRYAGLSPVEILHVVSIQDKIVSTV